LSLSSKSLRCNRCGADVPTEVVPGFCGSIMVNTQEYRFSNATLLSYLTCGVCTKPLCLDCKEEYGECGHPEVARQKYLDRMRAAARDRRN